VNVIYALALGCIVFILAGLWLHRHKRKPTARDMQQNRVLTLQDRNDRDRKIAHAVVKNWRRKGLP
jgi:hypothetical protein